MFSRRNLIRGGLATAAVAFPVPAFAAQPNDTLVAVQAFADDLAVIDGKEAFGIVHVKQRIAAELHAILAEPR